MSKRDSFLLRIDPLILEAIRKWSEDEMRSMNSQIEFILRKQLKEAGRLPAPPKATTQTNATSKDASNKKAKDNS